MAVSRFTSPRLLVLAAAALAVIGLAACGSSSDPGSTSTSAAAQQPGARRGVFPDPKVQACLKKAGVQLPQFHPGDTVIVQGTTSKDGTVTATQVNATASGATGGLGGLFGRFGGGGPGQGGVQASPPAGGG